MIELAFFKSQLQKIYDEAKTVLSASDAREQYEAAAVKFLGRKSNLSNLLRSIKDMPPATRASAGEYANAVRREITALFEEHGKHFEEALPEVNTTLPGVRPSLGHEHLVSTAINEIVNIFTRIGFERVRHPEIESDWYAFEALNMPPEHPARDDWETFFMDHPPVGRERFILTPHATSGTARALSSRQIPLRAINIQKCYRREFNASHTPMFHQFDGVYADHDVTIQHLKGVLEYFVKSYFGADRQIRLRPHHFRFTEPSFEIDITCGICGAKGCRFCKQGWLELGGAGMLHPNVIKAAKLNPAKVTALAFGWGVERTLMMRSGLDIPDIRILYENDLRFLEQF